MFPYFVVLDTNYDSITSLLATQILYFGPLRGVMKIRIAVTLVVLGLLYNNPQFSVRLTGVWIGVLLTPFILVALDGPSGQFFTIIDNSNTSLLIRHNHSPRPRHLIHKS